MTYVLSCHALQRSVNSSKEASNTKQNFEETRSISSKRAFSIAVGNVARVEKKSRCEFSGGVMRQVVVVRSFITL